MNSKKITFARKIVEFEQVLLWRAMSGRFPDILSQYLV